ncbi:MAG: transglutaminase domain-containing protein, partial [Spirochaetia bacterium]|nr:transglutaminase domain-containing protein [Spirochaetia bacterium]
RMAFPDLLTLSGTAEVSYKAYANHNLPSTNNKEVVVQIVRFPSGEDGLFLTQKITNYDIRWNSRPFKTEIIYDAYSNQILQAHFKPVRISSGYTTVSYEESYTASLALNLFELEIDQNVPYLESEMGDYERQFLKECEGIHFAGKNVAKKAQEIAGKNRRAAEVIFALTLWVSQEITNAVSTNESEEIPDSVSVLEKRRSGRLGKLNLLTAMIRSQKIPARLVRGFCVDHEIRIEQAAKPGVLFSPGSKGDSYWIEVYFPTYGFVPVDPEESIFFLLPGRIKRKVALSLSELQDPPRPTSGYGSAMEDSFYEVQDKPDVRLRVASNIEATTSFFFSAPVNGKHLVKAVESVRKGKPAPAAFPPGNEGSQRSLCETLRISGNPADRYYGERFYLASNALLSRMEVSLFRLVDNGGLVSLQICKDQDGEVGEQVAESDPVKVTDLRVPASFRWVGFNFGGAKKSVALAPGWYWIIPRLRGNSVVHWAFQGWSPASSLMNAFVLGDKNVKKGILAGQFLFRFASPSESSR